MPFASSAPLLSSGVLELPCFSDFASFACRCSRRCSSSSHGWSQRGQSGPSTRSRPFSIRSAAAVHRAARDRLQASQYRERIAAASALARIRQRRDHVGKRLEVAQHRLLVERGGLCPRRQTRIDLCVGVSFSISGSDERLPPRVDGVQQLRGLERSRSGGGAAASRGLSAPASAAFLSCVCSLFCAVLSAARVWPISSSFRMA